MTGDWRISSLQYGSKTGLRREDIREIIRCAVTDSMVTTGDFRTDIGDSVPAPLRFIRLRISGGLSQKMKDSEVLILRRSPPFYRQLASRSLLSVALLGCLPSLDAAVCVMRLHGLFFGTREQHIQFGGLFSQTLVSRFSIPELPLYDSKYVLYFCPDR